MNEKGLRCKVNMGVQQLFKYIPFLMGSDIVDKSWTELRCFFICFLARFNTINSVVIFKENTATFPPTLWSMDCVRGKSM